MRLFRPGLLARCLYPEAIFRIKTTEKVLYLTFDDGPDPFSTPLLLDILERHGVKALFFCDGRAAEKYPDFIDMIRNRGHMIGNHGYCHLNGWQTVSDKYINDVTRASKFTSEKVFRPPYGRLSLKQKGILLKSFKIFFWDLMPYDFDTSFGDVNSLTMLKNKIRPGSIIVLHDGPSSCANAILEEFIIFAKNEGYQFGIIEVAD
jgi:peptidoglycan/xylan/chitin deacetylase (PgdA/CDA1 family)